MAGLISTTYSTALFDICVEENKVDEFMNEMAFINEVLNSNKDFFELLIIGIISLCAMACCANIKDFFSGITSFSWRQSFIAASYSFIRYEDNLLTLV